MEQPSSPGRDTLSTRIFECQECGRRYALELPSSDLTARCERCGATLLSVPANSLQRSLALTITGLVLVFVANTMPFMSLNIKGRFQQVNLITGDVALFDQGLWPLAALVLLTTIVAPTIKLAAIAYVLLGLRGEPESAQAGQRHARLGAGDHGARSLPAGQHLSRDDSHFLRQGRVRHDPERREIPVSRGHVAPRAPRVLRQHYGAGPEDHGPDVPADHHPPRQPMAVPRPYAPLSNRRVGRPLVDAPHLHAP